MKTIYKHAGISFLLALLLGLSACNTVKGIGRDLRAGGDAIHRAAE